MDTRMTTDIYGTTPSLATQKSYAIAKLATEANLIVQLIDRLKACTSLREPDKWGLQYSADEHLRLIERGDYRAAYNLITSRGR
jgi:hypothetical protein